MNWANLLIAVQQMSPVEAMLSTIMVIYFFYRSGANFIPFLKSKSKKKCDDESLIGLHKDCKNFASFGVILEKVMGKSDKIFRIRYQETLYDQMNEAELMWDTVRDLLIENYLAVLNSHELVITKAEINSAVYFYGKLIDGMEVDILGVVRRWMRKNHFADKAPIEYEAYINDKTKLLRDKVMRLFDESFDETRFLLPRSEIRDAFATNYLNTVEKGVHTFFLKAKATAEENLKRIKEIEEEISKI